jgi:hypothetical protein
MEDNGRQKRAELRRKKMVITKVSMDETEIDPEPVFGVEAMELAAVLSRQAWAFGGRAFPNYERKNTPVRFVRYDSDGSDPSKKEKPNESSGNSIP